MNRSARITLEDLAATQHLSARSTHRLMRVSRTIADLAGEIEITQDKVNAAAALRDPAAQLPSQLAA